MNDLDLEPLPDDVAQALGSLAAPPPVPPGVAEAVLLKVKASAGLAAVAGAASSASAASGASAAVKGGASVLLKVLPVVTLTAGLGLGIAVDRLVLRPSSVERVVVVERADEAAELPSPVVSPPPAPAPQKKPPRADTLGKERVLLDVARSAVNARDWAKALAAVASHETNFPSGQLVEEREALAIQALSGAGQRAEARRHMSAFTTRFPDSPLRTSLETMVH
jgi:hypothetical protein